MTLTPRLARLARRASIAAALPFALSAAACRHGAALSGASAPSPASTTDVRLDSLARDALAYAQVQLRRTADSLDPSQGFPRSTGPDGRWVVNGPRSWTSGFFAGELWYMYERTKDPYWRAQAERWTAPMEQVKTMTTTHDLGFMIFDSFGQEYRLTGDPHAKAVVLEAAASLAHRFNPAVGATQSWERRLSPDKRETWEFPVIIDNLMNLPLLFWAGAHGGDPAWGRMAEQHALTSLRYHVRPDGSTGHVALFDPQTGAFRKLVTAQGAADTSVWARGQAWAIYGFTSAYDATHRPELLAGARRVADWYVAHLPADAVPYWDFDAPGIPDAERDASAAAIAASGLLALAKDTKDAPDGAAQRYRATAERTLVSLATRYTTRGTSSAAILSHAVGGHPQHVEIDVGLVYADYYFVEALTRYLEATDGAARAALDDWPAGASPREVGALVARNVADRPFGWEGAPRPRSVSYPEVVSWYGALTFADAAHDDALRDRLIHRIDTLRTPEGAAHVSRGANVDSRVFGAVPLEIAMLDGDTALRSWGKSFADRQWENPSPDGITREARYWVDDMYMSTIVQLQAYRATGDRRYLDRSARMMAAYLDSLQQPDGLFHHAADSPFNWGRGNGWFAAGMAEMLRSLPADHPLRPRIMAGYTKMMAALLKYQSPEGLWRQLVDRPESWIETSGSGMFTFAMVTGVKNGWLDAATYGPAARRAWLALVRHIDAQGNIDDVCIGTNKAEQEVGPDLQKQYDYYLARPRHTGDLHGEAPVLWTATALLR